MPAATPPITSNRSLRIVIAGCSGRTSYRGLRLLPERIYFKAMVLRANCVRGALWRVLGSAIVTWVEVESEGAASQVSGAPRDDRHARELEQGRVVVFSPPSD